MKSSITSELADAKNLHLQCDGWSNIRNESVINFIISKPEPVFVKFVASEDEKHTGEYLAKEMSEVIMKYGPEKFFVVIGDNAANMKKALNLIAEKYNHLVPLGCVCHTLQLLCTDILSCQSAQVFLSSCIQIVKTIRNVHVLNALFTKINKDKNINISLTLPCKTRWGSNLNTLQSLLTCKNTLQTLAVNEQAAESLSKELKARILDDNVFWVRVEKLIMILQPIVTLIKKFETDECSIHRVHPEINDLQEKLVNLLPQSPLSKTEESTVLKKTEERRKMALGPIHLAATLLDPSNQGCYLSSDEQVEAMEFVYTVYQQKHKNTDTDTKQISTELANYCAKEGVLWSKQFVWTCAASVSPIAWWKGICRSSCLSETAIRILSPPVSSAATERSFSTFSWIHNKKRNRLTNTRAGKITYLACNWKLIHKQILQTQTITLSEAEATANPNLSHLPIPGPSRYRSTPMPKRKLNFSNGNDNNIVDEETDTDTSDGETEESESEIPYMESDNDIDMCTLSEDDERE